MSNGRLKKYRLFILYGISLAGLLVLLKWLELKYLVYDHVFEVYAGAIALLFLLLGIWVSKKLTRPKVETKVIEKHLYKDPAAPFIINQYEMALLGISHRELEVLQYMAEGWSNQQIADRMFVSLNTIKTHIARIFEKLDVQRRTQAVDKAKRIGLIA